MYSMYVQVANILKTELMKVSCFLRQNTKKGFNLLILRVFTLSRILKTFVPLLTGIEPDRMETTRNVICNAKTAYYFPSKNTF